MALGEPQWVHAATELIGHFPQCAQQLLVTSPPNATRCLLEDYIWWTSALASIAISDKLFQRSQRRSKRELRLLQRLQTGNIRRKESGLSGFTSEWSANRLPLY